MGQSGSQGRGNQLIVSGLIFDLNSFSPFLKEMPDPIKGRCISILISLKVIQ